MELLDELYSGVPVVGAPAIQQSFGISYEATAATLLVVPALVAMAIEPVIFLLADRHPRRWFVAGGLAAMAVAALASALAPGPVTLSAAISLAFVASGAATALAQATLADDHPDDRERVMTRWALLGEIGDLAAPALFALLTWLSLGWRGAYLVVGVLTGALALGMWTRPFPPSAGDDEEDEPGLWTAFRTAIRNPRLLWWLGACFVCDLLDEIFVVFAALRLRDDLGAGPDLRSLALGVFVAGGILGLLVTERTVQRRPLHVLVISAATSLVVYVVWLATADLTTAIVALFALGASTAPLYPIAIAQAYAALPGRSGAVNAAGHLFTPLSLAVPWLLGVIADRHGITATLSLLAVQPILLLFLGLRMANERH